MGDSAKTYEWSARIRFDKFELRSSFTVLIFLGPVPEKTSEWRSGPNYVGGHRAYVDNSELAEYEAGRAPCVSEGFVQLNRTIAALSGLNSFEPAVVEPYLKRELSWKIQKADRSLIPIEELTTLEVVVLATTVGMAPGDMFPKPIGGPVPYNGITEGKPGGYVPHKRDGE